MSILPNATQSAPGVNLYAPASGGGGGGGGPNLLVSTIGVNPNGGINMFTDSNIDAPPITFYLDGTNTSAVNLQVVYGANESTSGIGAGEAIGFITNASGNPFAPITCYQVQLCDSLGNLAAVLEAGPTPGSAYISSIYVSSLNGAAPGGGGSVPADLSVSTLRINDSVPTNSAQLRFNGVDPNLYNIGVTDSNGAPVASLNLGFVSGRNQLYTDVAQIPLLYTSSVVGATSIINMNPTGGESLVIGGLGPPGDFSLNTTGGGVINLNGSAVNVATAANISSLTVSSINNSLSFGTSNISGVSTINGAAYPPYSPPVITTLPYSQTLTVPSQNISGATPLSTLSTLSQSFTFTDFFTYTGPITAQMQFNGTGNTNNFTKANGTDEALFNKAFTFTPQGGSPLAVIVSQDEEGGSLTGSFGPNTQNQPLNILLQNFPGSMRGSFDIKNAAQGGPGKGQYYNGPGVEANITFYGPGTVTVQDTIDFQLSSGDPSATYEFVYFSPVNSNGTGVQSACISYR